MIDVSPFVETLNGKPVALFGLGVSGLATLAVLTRAGATVYVSDNNTEIIHTAILEGGEPKEFTGEEGAEILKTCACLILSPGVPLHYPAPHPVVEAARAAGIEIISDIEVFGRSAINAKTIGITGTNGKSTTAALLHHVLGECGVASQLGGNIGKAVLSLDMPPEEGVFILELSSYQLDLCPTFSPDIAVLLNVTPDHLDRHGSIENYAAAKVHIFEGNGEAIIATDDNFTKRIADDVARKGERSVQRVSACDVDFETSTLKGNHNKQNIAAILSVTALMGLDETKVIAAIKTFPGLPHRQFLVRVLDDVTYINDSKATNVEATAKALSSFDNIYWILGGRPKEGGLAGLEPYMHKVRGAFLIGEAVEPFADQFNIIISSSQKILHYEKSNTLSQALKDAHDQIKKDRAAGITENITVLLSPACASWDQFKSFEERGELFVKLVEGLG